LPEVPIREAKEVGEAAELLIGRAQQRAAMLERQSAELANLVEAVSDGLMQIGATGRIEFLNPAASILLDLPAASRGQSFAALVRSLELRQLIEEALDGRRSAGVEIALGDRRVLASAQPLPAAPGAQPPAAGGVVLALSDLTALRRLEGVRRDFVANVSHELKTPLTSIRGYAETLVSEPAPPEIQQQFLQTIQRNAARLQRIVDELLDLSAIESGGWKPDLRELNAAEVVADAWLACSDAARARDIRFEPPTGTARVLADPGGFRQVLGNLFDNALRYTPDGGVISVRVRSAPGARNMPDGASGMPAARVAIEVSDNGSGIPGDALPRIFERFYRVDPARSRAAGGTGLGLAIVKHLVESMGGEIQAESELGKGTVIRFTLPSPEADGSA
jgi:signal transduction histidine kinase